MLITINYIRLRTGKRFFKVILGSQKGHMFTLLHINILTLTNLGTVDPDLVVQLLFIQLLHNSFTVY